MAEFGDNPFADPEANNPFANPNTQQSSGTTAPTLDDYNPFEKQAAGQLQPPPAASPAAVQPVIPTSQPTAAYTLPSEPQVPPPYTASPAQQVDTAELQRRQQELEKKAQDLQEREDRLRQQAVAEEKQSNFPPIPSCIPIKPCFYQDIDMEIPPEFGKLTRLGYYLWIAHAVTYTLNFIFAIGYIATSSSIDTVASGSTMGLSILWFILFTPLSFVCWFRPLYKAFRSDSSLNFFVFFINSGIQVIVDIVAVLGPPGAGYLGILSATTHKQVGTVEAVHMSYVMWFMTVVYGILLACDLILLISVHKMYRGTGASFKQAQAEFTTGVIRNDTVRTAGSQFAADAASSAFNNAGGGGSGNRY